VLFIITPSDNVSNTKAFLFIIELSVIVITKSADGLPMIAPVVIVNTLSG
tara:strand:- start:124 stop:273 length:150 start_codon:yes stop_codon:yes gene_type:complete